MPVGPRSGERRAGGMACLSDANHYGLMAYLGCIKDHNGFGSGGSPGRGSLAGTRQYPAFRLFRSFRHVPPMVSRDHGDGARAGLFFKEVRAQVSGGPVSSAFRLFAAVALRRGQGPAGPLFPFLLGVSFHGEGVDVFA